MKDEYYDTYLYEKGLVHRCKKEEEAMRKKEITYEQEIRRMAITYHKVELPLARECYEDYISLILVDLPKYKRVPLRNLWEQLKLDN